MLLCDFYKTGHIFQYPENTTLVYSNLTPRGSRIPDIDKVVVFGITYFVKKYLKEHFNENFFNRNLDEVINEYKEVVDSGLGKDMVNVDHIKALHKLGYLPLKIKALAEGTLCPMRVPLLTIRNTLEQFAWLTNYIETLLSNVLWHPITSATIAFNYRKLLEQYAKETSDIPELVKWQGHDFSMRGHSSLEASIVSGAAHLTSFLGTDTVPAIPFINKYYKGQGEFIGGSVPATEHSVMCVGGKDTEFDTYKRLITEVYPKGIVSIVSDTWDYFEVLNTIIRRLKDTIMARDGKVVIRPDSGDPVDIICGDPKASPGSLEHKGTIEVLWDIFGGSINSKGFRQLDPHIGCIYGDSITMDRAKAILSKLKEKGFASTNIVFGIGSYTYQYVTRDTFGFAIKATFATVNGKDINISKNPKTDNGLKKSASGLLRVNQDLTLSENVNRNEEQEGMLDTVFHNGTVYSESIKEIRKRIDANF